MIGRRLLQLSFAIVVAALAIGLYLPSLNNPLIWDDPGHVELARDVPLSDLFGRVGAYRRPMVLLSYRAQSAMGLGDARSLHAANAAMHGANSFLLATLLMRLGGGVMVASAAALLFAFHPIQSAAVGYVSGRTDLLMLFFTLIALHLACGEHRALRTRLRGPGVTFRERFTGLSLGVVRASLMGAAIVAATMSKEPGMLAGPLAAGLRVATYRPSWRKVDYLVSAACVATAFAVVFGLPHAAVETPAVGWMVRLRDAGTTFITFVQLITVPTEFHLDRLTAVGPAPLAIGGAIVALSMITGVIGFTRDPTLTRFCVFAVALLYLPASNLIPVYPAIASTWVFTPEHFMYAPLAALAPLAAALTYRFLNRLFRAFGKPGQLAAALAVLVIASSLSAAMSEEIVARQEQLADAETVYKNTLAHSPSPRACFNLGNLLIEREAYQDAASVYRRCAVLSPKDAGVYVQLGVTLQKTGDPVRARMAYATALQLEPENAVAWSNMASLDASQAKYDEARKKWNRALEIDPKLAPAREGLAKLARARRAAR